MKLGDFVRRTYGEGKRPAGIIVRWCNSAQTVALVQWIEGNTYEMHIEYLEIINESR